MGEQKVKSTSDSEQIRVFERCLLNDVKALECMLETGMIESGVSRMGAEQELVLINSDYRPCPKCMPILEDLKDPNFTTELGRFNIEFNLAPLMFADNCLQVLETQLHKHIKKVRNVARKHGADIFLSGILPTLRKQDLGLENMTPKPRYHALNEAMNRLRGNKYSIFLRGIDELYLKHDSVMLEACNTSFQVHFQVSAENFARYYNIAQAVAGPVLAAAVNSPLLFGKRLWNETRIAVFQQSTDTRSSPRHIRHNPARVTFGNCWVKESILEIFQEDIARFRVLFAHEVYEEDALQMVADGKAPGLKALQLHNGTIYRWTRPCYGITNGKPHLRIENRLFPSGPTIIDEVANAAFWLGLIKGMTKAYPDITRELDFDDVKANFYAAARGGLKAQFVWPNHETIPAQDLILKQLLPMSREGLQAAGLDSADITRYLDIIEERVSSGRTGAQWMLSSFSELKRTESLDKCLLSIAQAASDREKGGKPVHKWKLAGKADPSKHFVKIEQIMTTDLFTVNPEDSIDLVLNVMHWRHIRHIPVEDNNNRLVGMVNYRSLVNLIREGKLNLDHSLTPVSTIMQTDMPTVQPSTPTQNAIELMRSEGASCLPIVYEEQLVGIVTERDFLTLAAEFLEATAQHQKKKE